MLVEINILTLKRRKNPKQSILIFSNHLPALNVDGSDFQEKLLQVLPGAEV